MESWYSSPIHLNSSSNSRLFVDEQQQQLPASVSAVSACPSNENVSGNNTASTSKMLPDFLSDGPIIHSSQRLADVAAGLPSNSMDSPEELNSAAAAATAAATAAQLSRLRMENERLLRDLAESSLALNEQTRRANDLERQLHLQQRSYCRTSSNADGELDNELQSKPAAAVTGQEQKLRAQIAELTVSHSFKQALQKS